jgi:hypothetical protein
MTNYRMGDELVSSDEMKAWHNSRGLPWGPTFEGPDQITIGRQVRPSNINVHLANEHGIEAAGSGDERALQHLLAHLYARFRDGQGHYHTDPKGDRP